MQKIIGKKNSSNNQLHDNQSKGNKNNDKIIE